MKKLLLFILLSVFIVTTAYSNPIVVLKDFTSEKDNNITYLRPITGAGIVEFKALSTSAQRAGALKTLLRTNNDNIELLESKAISNIQFVDISKVPIQLLTTNEVIEYFNPVLLNESGEIQTPSNKMFVEIKNGYVLKVILDSLNIETTSIKPLNPKIKNTFIITLKNGSNLASIDIANTLYKTEFFVSVEPDFYRTITLDCKTEEYFNEQ